jgi:hypothetical protein
VYYAVGVIAVWEDIPVVPCVRFTSSFGRPCWWLTQGLGVDGEHSSVQVVDHIGEECFFGVNISFRV